MNHFLGMVLLLLLLFWVLVAILDQPAVPELDAYTWLLGSSFYNQTGKKGNRLHSDPQPPAEVNRFENWITVRKQQYSKLLEENLLFQFLIYYFIVTIT